MSGPEKRLFAGLLIGLPVVTASLRVFGLVRTGKLLRRGFAPELKIGVRKQDGAFDAHAWVELQGVALGQSELVHQVFSVDQRVASQARRP